MVEIPKKCHKTFSSQFPSASFPSKSTIYELENKVQKTGFLLQKIQEWHCKYVLLEETLYGTGMCSEACPRKCLGWLSHNNSVRHIRITWAHRCKTASSQTIQLYSFAKSSGKLTLQKYSCVSDTVKLCVVTVNSILLYFSDNTN
jgi:hypothetical protein